MSILYEEVHQSDWFKIGNIFYLISQLNLKHLMTVMSASYHTSY